MGYKSCVLLLSILLFGSCNHDNHDGHHGMAYNHQEEVEVPLVSPDSSALQMIAKYEKIISDLFTTYVPDYISSINLKTINENQKDAFCDERRRAPSSPLIIAFLKLRFSQPAEDVLMINVVIRSLLFKIKPLTTGIITSRILLDNFKSGSLYF